MIVPVALLSLAAVPAGRSSRAEHFVLEIREPAQAQEAQAAREVGLVCLRRRAIEGGFQLEGEWLFRRGDDEGGDERVLHVEKHTSSGSWLVWREWGPSRARTLSAERAIGAPILATVDAGRGGACRETLDVSKESRMPLELLEAVREGSAAPVCERFDPLSRSLEHLEVRTVAEGSGEASWRTVELVRADGTIAGRYEFLGRELRSFRWQEGDLSARRITEADYRTRSDPSTTEVHRP